MLFVGMPFAPFQPTISALQFSGPEKNRGDGPSAQKKTSPEMVFQGFLR